MSKSLTEAAKAVLEGRTLDEGYGSNPYPSVGGGSVSNPDPVDPSTASTGNAKTLRPGAKSVDQRQAQTGKGAPGPEAFPGPEDLGGATPTSTAKDNLGAKAAGGNKRDTSVKGSGSHAEPAKHLEEDDEVEGDVVEENATPTLAERLKAIKEARKMYEKKEEDEKEKCDEELELSEELEDFINEAIEAGLSEEEIMEAIDENFEFISEEEELDEEQIDEISRATLTSYRKKANRQAANLERKVERRTDRPGEEEKMYKRIEGSDLARRKMGVRVAATEEYEDLSEELENYEVDMSEHVDALLAGENLSEDFHAKATTIFEAAVKSKLEEEVALLEQAYAETLEERVAEIVEQLSTDVDNYLNYVVEQWVEENEVAIESALRSELTEDFISGLRALFAEHYIDVPEDSVNVVEELSSTVEELEEKLNEEIERNVQLTAALNESVKYELVSQVCEGLTATQAEKLKSLAENVTFTDEDEFIEKISTLRENYFSNAVKTDEVLDRVESQDPKMISESALEGPMSRYVQALGRSLPK